jgi:thioredoxin-dependent peroxiredoxin
VNAAVLGVSAESEASHKRFAEKYGLPFALLADPDRTIVQSYGVWGEKKNYGRTYMGTHRVTYVIDEKGKVEAVLPKVSPKTHAEELLKLLGGA